MALKSRAQRLLLAYLLYEISKPRVSTRKFEDLERKLKYAGMTGGATPYTLETHGNTYHSPNFEEEGLSLLLDGTRTMTDNLDMDSHNIKNVADFGLGIAVPLANFHIRDGTTLSPTVTSPIFVETTDQYVCEYVSNASFSGFLVRNAKASGVPYSQWYNSVDGTLWTITMNGANSFNIRAGNALGTIIMQFASDEVLMGVPLDLVGQEIQRAGDISHLDGKFPIFDKASGNGIKVDTTTPTFGWRDLLGEIRTRGVGATDPNDAVYDGANIRAYQFAVNDECWINFHIPHDYVKGTDIHLHFHWSHNGTLVTGGNVTWGADITYAKGHNQTAFPASVNPTVVGNASTTQYQHIITEVQISASTPSATQIDSDNLEPDGVIMIRAYLSANNITVSGGAVPDPFLHFVDVHYQSSNIGTKGKVPDFYA